MASLLQEDLFEARAQAPAPSKDFYQLIVTRKENFLHGLYIAALKMDYFKDIYSHIILPAMHIIVIFRWWKISLRSEFREAKPGELKESHEYFLDDPSLQIQIAVVFGANILEHIFNLCRGNFDFLERLPDPLLLYIISFLELEDIARLSQVSHRFEMICNSDTLWEKIVQNLCGAITPEMRALAQEVGWKQFFFTNKLQLQLQLRRRRQKQDDSKKGLTK